MRVTLNQYEAILRNNPDVRGEQMPKPRRGDGTVPLEADEQAAVVRWAQDNERRWPELRWLFAVPNGEYRDKATAARLATQGVKRGVSDLLLLSPRRGADGRVFHGLAIEMKRRDRSNHLEPEQKDFLAALREAGYLAVCCFGADEAIRTLKHYLSLD